MIQSTRVGWGSHGNQFGAPMFLLVVLGCSGRVDLGATAVAERPPPTTDSVEVAAQTTSIMQLTTARIAGIAVDDNYLYLATASRSDSYLHDLQRCKKSDCLNTLTRLRSAGAAYGGIGLSAGQLGWTADDGFQICAAPDCTAHHAVSGVVVSSAWDFAWPVWDGNILAWPIQEDRAIYICSMPNCANGPRLLVVGQNNARDPALADQDLYWRNDAGQVLRSPTDGSRPAEQLTPGEQAIWGPPPVEPQIKYEGCNVQGLNMDGPWLYLAIGISASSTCGAPCVDCNQGVALARWRRDEIGAPREWILVNDGDFANVSFVEVIDGEVIWENHSGDISSCRADDCSTTKRQMGVNALGDTMILFQAPTKSVVADDKFIYWLSAPPQDLNGSYVHSTEWNIKRTPRIPK